MVHKIWCLDRLSRNGKGTALAIPAGPRDVGPKLPPTEERPSDLWPFPCHLLPAINGPSAVLGPVALADEGQPIPDPVTVKFQFDAMPTAAQIDVHDGVPRVLMTWKHHYPPPLP